MYQPKGGLTQSLLTCSTSCHAERLLHKINSWHDHNRVCGLAADSNSVHQTDNRLPAMRVGVSGTLFLPCTISLCSCSACGQARSALHAVARLRIVEQAAGHLRWKVNYPPSSSQPVGSGFEPHWRPQPAKLPLFGGYSLETLPYLTLPTCSCCQTYSQWTGWMDWIGRCHACCPPLGSLFPGLHFSRSLGANKVLLRVCL